MKRGFLIFCFILFSLNFISSAPPVTTVDNFPKGYLITEQKIITLKAGSDYGYHFFVSNASDGKEITNDTVNCTFFMANSTGNVIFGYRADYVISNSSSYWSVIIPGEFLTKGDHPYGLNCRDGFGGSLSGTFLVTSDGKDNDIQIIIVDVLLLLTLIILIFFINMKHEKTDFDLWDKNLVNDHKNMGQTFIKSFFYTLFKNSFIWIYFIGWLIILVLNHLIEKFSPDEIIEYFSLIIRIYEVGLILVVVFFIGLLASYLKRTFAILEDKNWGLGK